MQTKAYFPLFLFVYFLSTAHAEINRWVDEHGRIQFSDRPLDSKIEKVNVDTQRNSYGGGGTLKPQKCSVSLG
ncbi:MAG: DUF4124 domain-containing protein [Oleispira antarctica]|uniref:DUF4124 domain-containing protein n=1 Tax=Oleispira antarctica RB-8 TaxID=698738 RepID=R4YSH8_OLEAN|nr:DUF4124 domain-containing protein [Oleispira antarctica]MBQ0792338.1 DUF4124 domain-containing protein [Oleispira antarctica]CCK77890.1 hypothetical protein OLEAN_C37140 [Oleispira antarctica RB-8]